MGMGESLWNRVFRLAVTGILPLLAVVMVIPLVSVLALSFSSKAASDMNAVNLLPVGFISDSWRYILFDRDIWRVFFITVAATASGVVLPLAITSLLAYPPLKKEFKVSKLLMVVALITMVFRTPVVLYFLTLKNIGPFDNPLVLVLPQILTAHNMAIMRSFFQQSPKKIEEATMIDGVNCFEVSYRIMLPSPRAVLVTVGLFYGVTLWSQFQHPMMFIQDMELFPLRMRIRQLIGSGSELQDAVASIDVNRSGRTFQAVVVVFAVLSIITAYLFIQRYFTKGAMLGSVKG